MPFQIPALPYNLDALEPHVSKETLSFHYGKHHRAYVDKMNKLLESSPLGRDASLEDIVRESSGALFNNSAQAWNHTFFWHCMSPHTGDHRISRTLEKAIGHSFGTLNDFFNEFSHNAVENFGSGWTWLVKDENGDLSILNTSNAETPISGELVPLLVVDVWEHAYYIDYRNARKKYLESFQKIMHWKFASERYDSQDIFNATKEMRTKFAA